MKNLEQYEKVIMNAISCQDITWSEKSGTAFFSDDSWVKVLHLYFFSRAFSVLSDRNTAQASFNTRQAFLGVQGSEGTGGVKLAFSDSPARIPSGLGLRMETGKLWRWAEKSFGVRKLVTKPEARQGKITQWFEPRLLSLPNRAHLIVCLKQGCHYLNLTFQYTSFAHRFQRI